jgi:hypothetical protein
MNIIVELEDLIESIRQRAKERQRLSQGRGQKGMHNLAHLNGPEVEEPTTTRKELAKLAGVSPERAKRQGWEIPRRFFEGQELEITYYDSADARFVPPETTNPAEVLGSEGLAAKK